MQITLILANKEALVENLAYFNFYKDNTCRKMHIEIRVEKLI